MRLFWNSIRLLVAVTMIAAMFAVMSALSTFMNWLADDVSKNALFIFVGLLFCVCMTWGIWMEKREQKRLGIKRPIFRWYNDP